MADQWKKIKAEYIRGGVSFRKLAEKHGVSFSTLRKIAAKEKWTDLRNKAGAKRDSKIVDSVASQEASKVDKIQTIADRLLEMITERIEEGNLIYDAKDLRSVTASIKDLREIKGMKSELDAQEQIARIEKLKREATADTADKEIRVVIAGDLDEYAE